MDTKDKKQRVVVVGAGPAGLTAAYALLKTGRYDVTVVEATQAIGGISRTACHNGNRMDLGGHRFFTKSDEINALWQEILPLQGAPAYDDKRLGRPTSLACGGPDPETTDEVMLVRERTSRIFYNGAFFDYPISMSWATFRALGFQATLKAGLGYIGSVFHKRKERSLEDFYINRFGRPLYEMFFEDYTEKVWGRHPSEIAADWGAQRVKGLSLWKTLTHALTKPFRRANSKVETSLIERFHYPKLGPGQWYETLASRVESLGGTLVKGVPITRIELDDTGAITTLEGQSACGETRRFDADICISSMPIKDLFAALVGPRAPHAPLRELAEALPYRDFITVGLLVDRLELKNETKKATLGDLVPDNWIYIQDRSVRLGRLQIFNNWSPYLVADPEHTVWMGLEYFANEGDELWTMDDDRFIAMAVDELVSIGVIARGAVRDAVRLNVKKAYPAYFGAYTRFSELRAYLDLIPNLYPVGRNGQHRYNNMDHSMLTALRAVEAIEGHVAKDALWTVNAEADYHETKSGA